MGVKDESSWVRDHVVTKPDGNHNLLAHARKREIVSDDSRYDEEHGVTYDSPRLQEPVDAQLNILPSHTCRPQRRDFSNRDNMILPELSNKLRGVDISHDVAERCKGTQTSWSRLNSDYMQLSDDICCRSYRELERAISPMLVG